MFNFTFASRITDEERRRRNSHRTIEVISDEQRQRNNYRQTIGLTDEERRRRNSLRTIEVISDEQRQINNYRASNAHLSDNHIFRRHYQRSVESRSDDQRIKRNFQQSIAGLSDQQRLVSNNRRVIANIVNRNISFKSIPQMWNDNNPCIHCSCVHLVSASISQKKLCCNGGLFLTNPKYPKLFELPQFLKNLILNRTEHLSSRSSYYNNIFSIAVTGYDNGKEGVGTEQINGPSALKINGRSFHFFPSSSKQRYGGIANFTYDGSYQAENHADSINENQTDERVKRNFVKGNINY